MGRFPREDLSWEPEFEWEGVFLLGRPGVLGGKKFRDG